MSHPRINQKTAVQLLQDAFNKVVETQQDNISEAAKLIVQQLGKNGIIQVFGTGHSRSFAMEIAGRAGGLVPASKLSISDLVFFGDTEPMDVLDPMLERDDSLAERLLAVHHIDPADIFIICSNSGGNGSTVELARLVKERGHKLIAVTSMDHTTKIDSRHPSGQKLYQLADVVIDNGGVFGDAALQLPTGGNTTATSSLTGTLIAQMLVTEICGLLLEAEQPVPILISANIPGGDAHNDALRDRYGDRVKTSAP
ncbi:sugar isomerase domain-containing protein [Microlunatus panaciterrae]|uniref:Phosphosugar-binding protein n=1 Tax=Microlunatus panaciterrae TaxID=400768 RepID=A0ABS2RJY6_9ACTN|nr:SIS domain-containing protein [Microlunatus panaciterrae]MBM7799319.1 putative phosphosugar-binding protein [Microlunatus panaciterrae]